MKNKPHKLKMMPEKQRNTTTKLQNSLTIQDKPHPFCACVCVGGGGGGGGEGDAEFGFFRRRIIRAGINRLQGVTCYLRSE